LEFGKRLKKLRKESKLTQQELADKLNIKRSTLAGYESGKQPSYETLVKLSDIFNVSVDYILGDTDERKKADHIKAALSDDPELLEFWDEMNEREDLRMYFKKCSELSPETIKKLIHISKVFEEEERERHGG